MVRQEFIFKIVVRFNSPNSLSEVQDTVNSLMTTQLSFMDDALVSSLQNAKVSQKITVTKVGSGKYLVYPKFGIIGDSNIRQRILNKRYDLIYDNFKKILQTQLITQLNAIDFEWHIHKTTGVVDE